MKRLSNQREPSDANHTAGFETHQVDAGRSQAAHGTAGARQSVSRQVVQDRRAAT